MTEYDISKEKQNCEFSCENRKMKENSRRLTKGFECKSEFLKTDIAYHIPKCPQCTDRAEVKATSRDSLVNVGAK